MVSDTVFIFHIYIPCGTTLYIVPKSRSSVKFKVKYQGHSFGKNGRCGGISVSQLQLVSSPVRRPCVIRRASCVIHNFFKRLLLNHWANLDETWQGCSLGEALPKLFKRLNSNHNSGCHGNQKEKK